MTIKIPTHSHGKSQGKPDKRYEINKEYDGSPSVRYVVRFNGKFISSHADSTDATKAAEKHKKINESILNLDEARSPLFGKVSDKSVLDHPNVSKVKDEYGSTPLHYAAQYHKDETVRNKAKEMLKQHGLKESTMETNLLESITELINNIKNNNTSDAIDNFNSIMATKATEIVTSMTDNIRHDLFSKELTLESTSHFLKFDKNNKSTEEYEDGEYEEAPSDPYQRNKYFLKHKTTGKLIGLTYSELSKLKRNYKNQVNTESLEDFTIEELEDFMMSEEYKQLDEISKKTLGDYIQKASDDKAFLTKNRPNPLLTGKYDLAKKYDVAIAKRRKGIADAVSRLTKE